MREYLRWWKAVRTSSPGAAVELVEYVDYTCPACKGVYRDSAAAIAKLQAQYPGRITFQRKPYPLAEGCNEAVPKGLTAAPHRLACEEAIAVLLARRHGDTEPLEKWLFEHTPVGAAEVWAASAALGGVTPAEIKEYSEVTAAVRASTREARERYRIHSTPVFLLGGVRVPPPYTAQFAAILGYELER